MRQKRCALPLCLVLVLLFLLKPIPADACSCATMPSPEEGLLNSQAVFSGEVTKITDNSRLLGKYGKNVLFTVKETWKGTNEAEVAITTGYGGGDCGVAFVVGQEYLVYANQSAMYKGGELSTIICSPTKALADATEDITILGQGEVPMHDVSPVDSGKKAYLIIGGVVVIAGLLTIVGWMRYRKVKS